MIDRKILVGLILVLVATCYDLTRSYLTTTSNGTTTDGSTSSSFNSHSDELYRNVFEQFAQLVRTHYPGVEVVGDNYPPPPTKALIARIINIVKMALLVCLLFGQNPFVLLNIPTPAVYSWALQNKMYACLMVFFFTNSIESHLVSTGAFEIYFNDVPLWSKLETGRLPSANEFVQMLQTFAAKPELHTAARSTF